LGTYGLFTHLEEVGLPVKRVEQPAYVELKPEKDTGRTLLMLNPLVHPNVWEWDVIMKWVAAGNRLVTSGFYGPRRNWFHVRDFEVALRESKPERIRLLLPVDSTGQFGYTLASTPYTGHLPDNTEEQPINRKIPFYEIRTFGAGMQPFLAMDSGAVAAKKAVGTGEWIVFTAPNPFANSVLRDSTWYRFATTLLTADGKFADHRILFDEFHNGFRATKSLWELLKYYKFNTGLLFLGFLLLLYLFFTGIRILPPRPLDTSVDKDPIPGLRAMSRLLMKHRAWPGLIRRELRHLTAGLFKRETREEPAPEDLVDAWLSRYPLPRTVETRDELVDLIRRASGKKSSSADGETIMLFNTLVSMRKEMKR
jgi:hypothetical protein